MMDANNNNPSHATRKARKRKTYITMLMITTALATSIWTFVSIGRPGKSGATLLKWHFILMPFATVILLPASTLTWKMSASPHAAQSSATSRCLQKAVHAAFGILCFVVMSVGISIAYVAHIQQHFNNFYSLHAWVGLAALLAIKTNIVVGATGACMTSCGRIFGAFEPHRVIGRMAVGLSFLSAFLGFAELQTVFVRDEGPWCPNAYAVGVLAVATSIVGACVLCEISTVGGRRGGLQPGEKVASGGTDGMREGRVMRDDDDMVVMKGGMPPIENVNSDTREISSGSGSSR